MRAGWISIAVLALAGGLLVKIMLPVVQEDAQRKLAQLGRRGSDAQIVLLDAWYRQHGRWPATLAQAGGSAELYEPEYDAHAQLAWDAGKAELTLPVGKGQLRRHATLSASGIPQWDCHASGLLPQAQRWHLDCTLQ
ncbi:hypothetical protein SAMN02745857_03086 [Andreprevotia lacus DSM 23236]|jgi:hypothetical protein|uniref:Uncharacterized protein n=1 Tax=Andreprevotia lacus DSM 23236 TaxID=1121001 RepID=A0A1W1XVT9_9NEIS|nr:hypothetical protein [Andreprevotia lacus]SMC28053.1 hypothetical protein SAMN02745857_03086 [Andreprevotia lacus DSM 23236]